MIPPIPPETSLHIFLWLLLFFCSGIIGSQLNGRDASALPVIVGSKREIVEFILSVAKYDVISGIMGIVTGIITYEFVVERFGDQPNLMLLILVSACMSSSVILRYIKNTVTVFLTNTLTNLFVQALAKAGQGMAKEEVTVLQAPETEDERHPKGLS